MTGFVNSQIDVSANLLTRVSSYINLDNAPITVPGDYNTEYQAVEQKDSTAGINFIFKTSQLDSNVGLWINYLPDD